MDLNNIQQTSNRKWFAENGNYTHAINYELNENSTVIDLGGFQGKWVDMLVGKLGFTPNIILVEPIPEYYDFLFQKYSNNPKITVLKYGVSTKNYEGILYLNSDGTSQYIEKGNPIKVNFITIEELLSKIGKTDIDLMQINIEGEEYPLLEQMLKNGTITKFKNIQIQYHTFIENAYERREKIREQMEEFFNNTYNYPFVFEGWSLK